MRLKTPLGLILVIALVLVFELTSIAEEKKPAVEINSFHISLSSSGNWVDTSFVIRNNTNKHINYVRVELSGWSKEKDGNFMISDVYISDPIPPNDVSANLSTYLNASASWLGDNRFGNKAL